MCDRSLCRPGYVGSLLNLPSATDSFYFPSLRATGSHQLAAASLPALSYPRSSIAWSPPASHAFGAAASAASSSQQPPPAYLSPAGALPLALHPAGGSKEAAEAVPPKYYAHEGAPKADRSRPSREPRGMPPPAPAKGLKYDEARSLPGPAAALLDADPASALREDLRHAVNLNVTLPPAAARLSPRAALQDGTERRLHAATPDPC